MVQSIREEYEIVYPFQVRDRSRVGIETRNYFYQNGTFHYETITFVVKSSQYGRLKLQGQLNQYLLPTGAIYKQLAENGTEESLNAESLENCYYQGNIQGSPDSLFALSTCRGLQGVIFIDNNTFVIHPLVGGNMGVI